MSILTIVVSRDRVMLPARSVRTPRSLNIDPLNVPDCGDASATDAVTLVSEMGPSPMVSAAKRMLPFACLVTFESRIVPRSVFTERLPR